jgi:hypothetical protein
VGTHLHPCPCECRANETAGAGEEDLHEVSFGRQASTICRTVSSRLTVMSHAG